MLDEIVDICVNKFFQIPETLVKGISKNDLTTKESFFTFKTKLYI